MIINADLLKPLQLEYIKASYSFEISMQKIVFSEKKLPLHVKEQ